MSHIMLLLLLLLAIGVTHAEEECHSNECPVQVNTLLQSRQQGIQSQAQDTRELLTTRIQPGECCWKSGEINKKTKCDQCAYGTTTTGAGNCRSRKQVCAQAPTPAPPPPTPAPTTTTTTQAQGDAQCDDTCYTAKGVLNPSKQCGKKKCNGCCECTGGECIDKNGLEDDENENEVSDEQQRNYECATWCYSKKHQSKPWVEKKCGWYGCSVCPECDEACENVPGWSDADGDDCMAYEVQTDGTCLKWGGHDVVYYANAGHTAATACCKCGGDQATTTTTTSTTTAATTTTTTSNSTAAQKQWSDLGAGCCTKYPEPLCGAGPSCGPKWDQGIGSLEDCKAECLKRGQCQFISYFESIPWCIVYDPTINCGHANLLTGQVNCGVAQRTYQFGLQATTTTTTSTTTAACSSGVSNTQSDWGWAYCNGVWDFHPVWSCPGGYRHDNLSNECLAGCCEVCNDTDNGATDTYGDSCSDYRKAPYHCNQHDDADFTSNQMCCVCGGGGQA